MAEHCCETCSPDPDPPTPGGDAAAMCQRWNNDRADLSEGSWSGSVASCNPGDISANGRANALRLVNLYRWLADLPTVSTQSALNTSAQACALIQEANPGLDHHPPSTDKCWTALGDEASGKSNISSGSGVLSVDMYMVDDGNATTLGHRRWILSNSLGPIGLGSTDGASCMQTIGGSGNAGAAWTAFPPPGPFPIGAVAPLPWDANLNKTGWSIQSDSIDLSGAQVTVTAGGQNRPVRVTQLLPGYGSSHAISIIPQGWTAQAGTTYSVSVSGVGQAINYQVQFVDCS